MSKLLHQTIEIKQPKTAEFPIRPPNRGSKYSQGCQGYSMVNSNIDLKRQSYATNISGDHNIYGQYQKLSWQRILDNGRKG